mmetsp:Transcript_19926/g.30783  ORF Transcript_19926/g.30783 Transcript_19926/m.30783 type:complete len:485 (-) Transcript_19926:257-1711(-)|eukprot:CAMPEP_0195291156 /NCGR_PEP_ID=MMETSP0707-20130614/7237_1 /TAXON_ID=33640 /ORGANISM="Asterionellopsis glacialis, Strain CCMP134" /LENGTH=484 /DNA_ID=CAMNT_0040351419 /DNA_START=180 /DNA_END=1634 /DNA_ORIENTATION=-
MKLYLLLSLVVSGHSYSSFMGGSVSPKTPAFRTVSRSRSSLVMYEPSNDPPYNNPGSNNMWSVLSNTERWISETLTSLNQGGGIGGGQNPYARKEVSYVCEMTDEGAMTVAGVFRRLREARELGETHGMAEEDRLLERGESYQPGTLRQTQVIVIPNYIEMMDNFAMFDNLIQVINTARRNARDYVTDIALEKLDDKMHSSELGERDWVVSVNCAHLHPKFGEKTPEQILEEMKQEEEEGEVDLNLKAYKERREAARRSPYPTLVMEVMASPPPDFGNHFKAQQEQHEQEAAPAQPDQDEASDVTSKDIQKLEALFGQSAAMNHPKNEKSSSPEDEAFFAAIGKVTGIDEVSLVTPMILAQNWIAEHDDRFDAETCAFTASDARYVDEGYEFIFTNLAMQASKFLQPDTPEEAKKAGQRQYMVMSNFLSSSATSMAKFAYEVTNIIDALPELKGKVQVEIFHPEHILPERRASVPIFALEWTNL